MRRSEYGLQVTFEKKLTAVFLVSIKLRTQAFVTKLTFNPGCLLHAKWQRNDNRK